MPIKEININNSYYKVVHKEGQERELVVLANKLNERIKTLKQAYRGKYSDLALMVLLALDLEDKLNEKQKYCDELISHTEVKIKKILDLLDSQLK